MAKSFLKILEVLRLDQCYVFEEENKLSSPHVKWTLRPGTGSEPGPAARTGPEEADDRAETAGPVGVRVSEAG